MNLRSPMIKMKRICLVLLLLAAPAAAQQGSSNQKFSWDQSAPTLVDAQAYTYKYYPDSAPVGIVFTGVICAGTASPFVCSVNIPAFTPGNHSIQLTASNLAGESTKSSPFAFVFVVTPSVPANIRITN